MFSWRRAIEVQPRSKNGQPPQTTTGVAKRSWTQVSAPGGKNLPSGLPARSSVMLSTTNGTDRTTPTQKRRVILTSSGLIRSTAVGATGSSAMPQTGQLPGESCLISGCIGQVHMASPVETPGALGAQGAGAFS